MKTIYKYPLKVTASQTVSMPVGAEILCVQIQKISDYKNHTHEAQLMLWALVEPRYDINQDRHIMIFGTGHEVTPHAKYIGTVQHNPLVWHVFEGALL